jgi:hypothetical protein
MNKFMLTAIFQIALLMQAVALHSVAFAEPQLAYSCSGTSPFEGSLVLTEDEESQVAGVDRTYFGFATRHHPQGGGLAALVMVLLGRNDNEPGVNRICFAWSLSRKGKLGASTSISGGEDCSGFTSKNGATMTLVGNGTVGGNLACDLKITE